MKESTNAGHKTHLKLEHQQLKIVLYICRLPYQNLVVTTDQESYMGITFLKKLFILATLHDL